MRDDASEVCQIKTPLDDSMNQLTLWKMRDAEARGYQGRCCREQHPEDTLPAAEIVIETSSSEWPPAKRVKNKRLPYQILFLYQVTLQ